jgi:hypothetical protein
MLDRSIALRILPIAVICAGCGGGSGSFSPDGAGSPQELVLNGFSTRAVLNTGPVVGQSPNVSTVGLAGVVTRLLQVPLASQQVILPMYAVDSSGRLMYVDPSRRSLDRVIIPSGVLNRELGVHPSGSRVAYAVSGATGPQIQYVSTWGGPATTMADGYGAKYSPSGSQVAFVRDQLVGGDTDIRVWTAGSLGQSPMLRLLVGKAGDFVGTTDVEWLSEDVIAVNQASVLGSVVLFRLSTGIATARVLAPGQEILDLEVSPDGSRCAFTTAASTSVVGVVNGDFDLSSARTLSPGFDGPGELAWYGNDLLMGLEATTPTVIRSLSLAGGWSAKGALRPDHAGASNYLEVATHGPVSSQSLLGAPYQTGAHGVILSRAGKNLAAALLIRVATPSTARIAVEAPPSSQGYGGSQGEIVYDFEADAITSAHAIVERTLRPQSVLTTGLVNGLLATFDANDGSLLVVMPYVETRSSSRTVTRQNGSLVFTGEFLGAFTPEGENLAPSGTNQVTIRNGQVVVR